MITQTIDRPSVMLAEATDAYRAALRAFAYCTGTGEQLRAAEAAVRLAGFDAGTGLVTLPVECVHFDDVRADGAVMRAVNGNGLDDSETWVSWSGRSLRFGVESRTYRPWELVQVRAR